ncbi:hypothetical protein E2C01_089833 [Portunus trituberculatus]|uniref:Uncharacterized protein n=1 Tax=Portunus trituberculatus TaxID=210409 RepID=A0A5B7JJB6_PORTR|nr:hypothetical protein [Portunus trituberculatus]
MAGVKSKEFTHAYTFTDIHVYFFCLVVFTASVSSEVVRCNRVLVDTDALGVDVARLRKRSAVQEQS